MSISHGDLTMLVNRFNLRRIGFFVSSRTLLLAAILVLSMTELNALEVEYVIDPTQSTLNLVPATFDGQGNVTSGTKIASTLGAVERFAGSLETSFGGSLFGNLENGVFTVGPQSHVIAQPNPSGPFFPSGTDTGSNAEVDVFGANVVSVFNGFTIVDKVVAIRDIEADITGGSLSLDTTASTFQVQVTKGIIDIFEAGDDPYFFSFGELFDIEQLGNSSQGLVTGNFEQSISIPFYFSIEGSGVVVEFTGQLVAQRVLPTPGDFDGNEVVNGLDLAIWESSYGQDGNADADGDGDSDGADFLIWQRNLSAGSLGGVTSLVPEPSSAWILMSCLVLSGLSRDRRNQRPKTNNR